MNPASRKKKPIASFSLMYTAEGEGDGVLGMLGKAVNARRGESGKVGKTQPPNAPSPRVSNASRARCGCRCVPRPARDCGCCGQRNSGCHDVNVQQERACKGACPNRRGVVPSFCSAHPVRILGMFFMFAFYVTTYVCVALVTCSALLLARAAA